MDARSFLTWFQLVMLIRLIAPVLSQVGFVSIDCGSEANYFDNSTGINWVTDAEYVSTGKNALLTNFTYNNDLLDYPVANPRQMGTLRYFDDPGRSKDCYVLPTRPERTYLIRVVFFYGDWGTVTTEINFDVYLNASLWMTLSLPQGAYQAYLDTAWSGEGVVYSSGSHLNICLVRKPHTAPAFISSLELRELANGMYSLVKNNTFLSLLVRLNAGPGANDPDYIRYPDDIYDRVWLKIGVFDNATEIRRTNLPYSTNRTPDLPPAKVMEDALFYYDSNVLWYSRTVQTGVVNVYATAYFQEIDGNASASNVRGMIYTLNDQYITAINATNQPQEVYGPIFQVTNGIFNMSFLQANWSRLRPILNALEIYIAFDFNSSATAPEDLSALTALQSRFHLTHWTGDPCLPVSYNWLSCNTDSSPRITKLFLEGYGFTGTFPEEIMNLTMLTDLLLSNNKLTGPIPDLSGLVHLQNLHLQNNSFNGNIPVSLAFLPNLTQLNLDNNNLSGSVPAALDNRTRYGLNFTVRNNPSLACNVSACGATLAPPPTATTSSNGSNIGAVVGGILGALAAIAVLIGVIWFICTRKRRARSRIIKAIGNAENDNPGEFSISKHALAGSTLMLTLQELSVATKKFTRKIGEGSFGPVYYGKLTNGQEVAVKVKSSDSRQGFHEFLNEVALLSRIHHRNLVSLVGYCEEADQQILVYVYVPNGTLRDYLYGDPNKKALDWRKRLDIALNAARGLEYLHTDCNPRIIHRDVKSSNILLDESLVAKVADFGISKQAPEGIFSGVDTLLKGTPGYFDPEYFISQRLTQKSDVYSFGVVLLEIITGRHPHVSEFPDGTYGTLIQWVQKLVCDEKVLDFVDQSLGGRFNEESMMRVVSLALSSTDLITANRPDMGQVVRSLTEAIHLELCSGATESTFVPGEKDPAFQLPSLPDSEIMDPGIPPEPR